MSASPLDIDSFSENGGLDVIIETVQGSGNKFKYDPRGNLFVLHHVLPKGIHFPYDFGFIPSTLGEDGDPLDVLVLMDAPVFPGCLVHTRLVGVIEAIQKEPKRRDRNDRLIAVERKSITWGEIDSLDDLPESILDHIESFFIDYNQRRGNEFIPQGRHNAKKALELVKKGAQRFRERRPAST